MLVWFVLLLPRPSEAAERNFGVVTLDLRTEAGEVPSHLCVVSESQGPRTRQKLWDVLDISTDVVETNTAGGVSWRVDPRVWGGDETSNLGLRCTDEPIGDCRPRVELPKGLTRHSDLYVACVADSLTEGGPVTEPRPVFVLLEYLEGSPPEVESVRLTGGVATIGVYGAAFDRVVVTARSLGGAYLPHRRSERGEPDPARARGDGAPGAKTIQLRLASRCRRVEVRIPRTNLKPSDRARLAVSVHGADIQNDRCLSNLVGSDVLQVLMPPAPLGVGSVEVELAATGDQAAARFGGSFEGDWPKTPFPLEFNQVVFSWRRPACIYPDDQCPTATLETGTLCSAKVTEVGCDYRCPGEVRDENAIGLELPLQVTFEKEDPKQRWTETLAQNGQVLTSYVPSDQIYLSANINDWAPVPDNVISKIEIYGEDGEARRYGVTRIDRLVLKVPGASCESVRFKPVGDRTYDEVVALVDDGRLDFGNPQRSARRVSFNLTVALGGGPAWSGSIETPPLYFSGLAMFATQYRPRRDLWNRFGFEFRFGGTLGQWATTVTDSEEPTTGEPLPAEPSSDEMDSRLRRFGWARVLFEPGVVVSLHERVAIGAGVGLGFSLPFRGARDLTNESLKFIYSPNLDLRFRLRSWLRLVLQFRGVFGEDAFTQEGSEPGGRAIEGQTARSLLTLFGLQASF